MARTVAERPFSACRPLLPSRALRLVRSFELKPFPKLHLPADPIVATIGSLYGLLP